MKLRDITLGQHFYLMDFVEQDEAFLATYVNRNYDLSTTIQLIEYREVLLLVVGGESFCLDKLGEYDDYNTLSQMLELAVSDPFSIDKVVKRTVARELNRLDLAA